MYNTKKSLLILLIGEIISIIALSSVVARLAPNVGWTSYFSIGAIVGGILTLIGVIRLRYVNGYLSRAFIVTIFQVFFSVLSVVFELITHNNPDLPNVVSQSLDIAGSLARYVAIYFIFKGCLELLQNEDVNYGKNLDFVFIISFGLDIVSTICLLFPWPSELITMFILIGLVMTLVYSITFIIILILTFKKV